MNRESLNKKNYMRNVLFTAVLILCAACLIGFVGIGRDDMYSVTDGGTSYYSRAKVVDVTKESLEKQDGGELYLGNQEVVLRVKNGPFKGEEVTVQNGLSTTHNIRVSAGQNVVLKIDAPEGIEPFYTIYNYDRTGGIAAIVLIFFALTAAVGRMKGVRSFAGLVFTLIFIVGFLLPALYKGYPAVLCGIVAVVVTASVSLLLINGYCRKTYAAIITTVVGVAVSGLAYMLFSAILHLTGYNADNAEDLLLISTHTGMEIGPLLFISLLVSSLGAVMDVSLSLASSLEEVKKADGTLSFRQLVISGLNVGKDMIGTMTNTLILAFTGSSLTLLLVLMSYGTQFNQLLSSDFLAIEIAQGISGGVGIVLCIPLGSAVSAFLYSGKAGDKKEGRSV